MPILDQWNLRLDADAILRGQGADPVILRTRRPNLVKIAEQAIGEALTRVYPIVLYERYPVGSILHNSIRLLNGKEITGKAISQYLSSSKEVLVMVCSIGAELEEYASQVMETDMVHGLALYGAGSAAVEALANAACQYFEEQAAQKNWQTTIPLSPGMIGWPIEVGQPQIFSLLNGEQAGVKLTESAIMLPMKSLSLILGLGEDLNQQGTPCDYCSMRDICKYRSDHAKQDA